MANINASLPTEMLREVFSYLPISDNFKLRCVCKLWHSILTGMSYRHLTIFKQNPLPQVEYLHRVTYDPIKSLTLIEPLHDSHLLSFFKVSIFQNVKKLTTFFSNVSYDDLKNFYNQFKRLETLTIDSNFIIPHEIDGIEQSILLNLDFLNQLNVDCLFFYPFILNTPKLCDLKCHSPYFYEFKYPDRIRVLNVRELSVSLWNPLRNLEVLIVHEVESCCELLNSFFERVSLNLKEIHFCEHRHSGVELSASKLNATLLALDSIRNQGKRRFEIIVFGFYYEHFKEFAEECKSKEWLDKNSNFLLENQSLLAKTVHCEFDIDYNRLENSSDKELEEFCRRIKKIRIVSVNEKAKSEKRLLAFLRTTKPERVELGDFVLYSESFSDKLLETCECLRGISLGISLQTIISTFDKFEFLCKLENLCRLKISNFFSLKFAITLLKTLKRLKDLRFCSQLYRLQIYNDYRMNGFKIYENWGLQYRKSKPFSDRESCICFFETLELSKGNITNLAEFYAFCAFSKGDSSITRGYYVGFAG